MRHHRARARAIALAILLVAGAAAVPAAAPPDRLDRFRELARSRLSLALIVDPDNPADAYRDLYALLDEEIVENLAAGGVFSSVVFLQDRLDAFGEAWGGAQIRLSRVDRLLVGAFTLTPTDAGNSIRVYGPVHGQPGLLHAVYREGRPSVHPLAGAPQFVAAWEGTPAGGGARALRVELLRAEADGVRVAWSTAALFPDGLAVRSWGLRPPELRLRYELHYPGWTPGCDGQTEQEDVYRLVPARATALRVSRAVHNGWHRELHASADRLFGALARRDDAALTALVPDRTLRARLPALAPEPACDALEAGGENVSVAAVDPDRRPWSLSFRRAGGHWRLASAAPVIQ